MASQHLNACGKHGDSGRLAHYAPRAVCHRLASRARVVSVTAGTSQLGREVSRRGLESSEDDWHVHTYQRSNFRYPRAARLPHSPQHGMRRRLQRKCQGGLKRNLCDHGERPRGLIRVGTEHIKQWWASIDLACL